MRTIRWGNGLVELELEHAADVSVRVCRMRVGDEDYHAALAQQSLVEIIGPSWGGRRNSQRHRLNGTEIGFQLRYVAHQQAVEGRRAVLRITQEDAAGSGLRVVSTLTAIEGVAAVTSTTTVSCIEGRTPVTLWAVTSLALPVFDSCDIDSLEVWRGESAWMAEHRWRAHRLRSTGIAAPQRGETRQQAIAATSQSSWSSGVFVPAGAVADSVTGRTLAWQVEHNGAWHWEVGESSDTPHAPGLEAYVAVAGPSDSAHQWHLDVGSESSFTTIPVTFSAGRTFDEAFGRLAHHRRAAKRPHPQDTQLPVIFNDWMNTLEGDATQEKLVPLIDAAAEIGAECFCLDAGWFLESENRSDWWVKIGDWMPSTRRFPDGLGWVLRRIAERGMQPGLWLEPEVVGNDSEAARTLPADAFFQRHGQRVLDRDRYMLDFRHPAAIAHLDATIDRLVELGARYFKFDYNSTTGPGSDLGGIAPGQGLLEHNRALLRWQDSLVDRHPAVIFESCASGGLRSDFATLARMQIQSTSDQNNPLLYPAIAVGALVHILPEQAGNWTYPQPDMSDDMIAFVMCNGLAGRMYHAGRVDLMSAAQRELVADGVRVHKQTRQAIGRSTPLFPLGLPSWDDQWTAVAFAGESEAYLVVWRQADAPATVWLPFAEASSVTSCDQIFPSRNDERWSPELLPHGIRLSAPAGVGGRMFKLTLARTRDTES